MEINNELKKYIEENIISAYKNFDNGHNVHHVNAVIERSLEYYDNLKDEYKLNINMVYAIAAYHDYGMIIERENHALHSAKLVMQDKNLKKFFTDQEISEISLAVSQHSTSSQTPPDSIYAKIVCDADKDRDVDVGVMRGYYYSLNHNKDFSFDQHVDNVHKEIIKRFAGPDIGGKSLVKFYISDEKNKKFMEEMLSFAYDKEKLRKKIKNILEKENLPKNN